MKGHTQDAKKFYGKAKKASFLSRSCAFFSIRTHLDVVDFEPFQLGYKHP